MIKRILGGSLQKTEPSSIRSTAALPKTSLRNSHHTTEPELFGLVLPAIFTVGVIFLVIASAEPLTQQDI